MIRMETHAMSRVEALDAEDQGYVMIALMELLTADFALIESV